MATFLQIIEQDGLPASVHTEKVILGAMMSEPVAVSEAIALLDVDDFSLESHRTIYSAMLELAEVGIEIDFETVASELKRRKSLDAVGSRPYLMSLTEDLPRHLAIGNYVKLIQEKGVLRKIIKACEEALDKSVDPASRGEAVLENLESKILDISSAGESREFATFVDALEDSGGLDAYVEHAIDPNRAMGQRSGFYDVDRMTSGMQPSSLIVIAARPSMGKTSLAINMAMNVADEVDPISDERKVVAVYSLEMTKESLFRRMLASRAGVGIGRLAASEYYVGEEERRKLRVAALAQGECRMFVDDTSSMTVLKLRAKARRLKQREGRLDLIVIDYLQLLSGSQKKYGNRQEEVAEISRGLKVLAKDLKVPVIALAQLSRVSEGHVDKRPMLSSLRESGQIEQDADIVAFIHREEYYDRDNEDIKGLAEFIIAKQRDGPTGTVHLAFHGEYTRYSNLARI